MSGLILTPNQLTSKTLAETYYTVKGFNVLMEMYRELKKVYHDSGIKYPCEITCLGVGKFKVESKEEFYYRLKQMAFQLFQKFDLNN